MCFACEAEGSSSVPVVATALFMFSYFRCLYYFIVIRYIIFQNRVSHCKIQRKIALSGIEVFTRSQFLEFATRLDLFICSLNISSSYEAVCLFYQSDN